MGGGGGGGCSGGGVAGLLAIVDWFALLFVLVCGRGCRLLQ